MGQVGVERTWKEGKERDVAHRKTVEDAGALADLGDLLEANWKTWTRNKSAWEASLTKPKEEVATCSVPCVESERTVHPRTVATNALHSKNAEAR